MFISKQLVQIFYFDPHYVISQIILHQEVATKLLLRMVAKKLVALFREDAPIIGLAIG